MKTASPILVAGLLAFTLTACAGRPQGPRYKPEVIQRALSVAPGEAQPSKIVATEVAMSQAERATGVWDARAQYAAPGAIMHLRSGPADASRTLAGLAEPGGPADWGTRTVVMSCDGALAVAQGRFRNHEGKFGSYLTTWVRQQDNTYKWTYNTDWIDDPQPPPRPDVDGSDSLITVIGIDAVMGLIASCPRADAPVPPPPAISIAGDLPGEAQLSKDGTLQWRWEHRPDGKAYLAVDYWYEGEWVSALEEGLASPREQ